MRILVLPLSALVVSLAVSAQTDMKAASPSDPGVLYLPATLNKTVRADKTHPGAAVHFTLDEPVLIGRGLVVPSGARLRGRVISASKLNAGQASQLAIVVDTAEWKHQKVPLHAFISGVVTIREVRRQKSTDWRCLSQGQRVVTSRNGLNGSQTPNPATRKQSECNNSWAAAEERVVRDRRADLKDVLLHRNSTDGSTLLFSYKKNVRLQGGTMLMLRNTSPVPEPSTGMIAEQ